MPHKTETRPNGLTLHFDYKSHFYRWKWVHDAKAHSSQFPGIVGRARRKQSQSGACEHAEEDLMRQLTERSKSACSTLLI